MILFVYGTRPEFIKIKPILTEMDRCGLQYKQLFTGQHENLVTCTPDLFNYIPENGLNRLDTIIQKCMNLPNEFFENITHILVQGDTTSALALSLSAMHRGIKIIHLEAGLRSYNRENPFPEENNRRLISAIADIHLCPTQYNKLCLLNENITKGVHVVGNTALDNLIDYKSKCEYSNKILVTLHRRENHDIISDWFSRINDIAKRNPDLEFIMPLHPNPRVQLYKNLLTNVNIVEPLEHPDLLELLVKTKLVITDSGGLQEECSFLNKRCLVCRKVTERPEALGHSSVLVRTPLLLFNIFNRYNKDYKIKGKSPFGDGKTSKKVVKILSKI